MVKCSECRKQLPRDHDAIKEHMRTEHMPDAGKHQKLLKKARSSQNLPKFAKICQKW